MKILVAGATGYLGGHFCEYFDNQGEEVVGFIRNPEKVGFLESIGVPFVLGDLTKKDTIVDALQDDFDVVVNAAGYVNDRGPIEKFRLLNVKTTENLAEAMVATGHSRLIHISSVAAYGDVDMRIDEEYEPKKHEWFKYGLTKLESEKVLDKFDLDTTILRPPHIIGERDRTGYIPVLYHSIRKSGTWIEEGNVIIPVVYVKDVCRALEIVIKNDSSINETYNVSSEEIIRIREVVEIIHDILALEIPKKSYSYWYASLLARISEFLAKFGIKPVLTRTALMMASKDSSFTSDKLRNLGWETTKSAEEMVKEWGRWRKEFEENREKGSI